MNTDFNSIARAAQIVSAYVGNNPVQAADLPALITSIHAALHGLVNPAEPVAAEPGALVPAVPVRKSITPDHIVCLENGLKFKSMKGHLRALGMTPDEYRAKWRLPADYPMVAPNYSATRSNLAKANGLGRKAA